MKYALIYSYENHNYLIVPSDRDLRHASEVERLYEFAPDELGTAKKILHNLIQAQAA